MDPWYYHVHQIPRVLINRRYMDDNASGGSGLEWLFTAQNLFQKFSEAGFVVLSHLCYTVECIPEPSHQTSSFLTCESVTKGFPSLRAAFPTSAFIPTHMLWLTLYYSSLIASLAHAVLFFTHRFSPFISVLHAVNTDIFFHFFILLLANVSAKLFFSLTFLFLLLISPYSIPPPGGVRFSLRLLQCYCGGPWI